MWGPGDPGGQDTEDAELGVWVPVGKCENGQQATPWAFAVFPELSLLYSGGSNRVRTHGTVKF